MRNEFNKVRTLGSISLHLLVTCAKLGEFSFKEIGAVINLNRRQSLSCYITKVINAGFIEICVSAKRGRTYKATPKLYEELSTIRSMAMSLIEDINEALGKK